MRGRGDVPGRPQDGQRGLTELPVFRYFLVMRFGGIVLAAALTLGACSSDPAPKEPEPSASTTSATPAVAVPTMPPQASEDSPEGAAAFVKHYVDVFNYAAATGDVEELRRLSAPGCEGCERYISLYEDTYKAGGYFKGGDWKIGDLELQSDPDETFATTDVEVAPTTYLKNSTSSPTDGPSTRTKITFGVVGSSNSKSISQLALGEA